MPKATLLIGDIGGTNARFAIANVRKPGFSKEQTLRCADFESADLAIRHYLGQVGASRPTAICLAAAGPIVERRVRFTNNSWRLDTDELSAEFDTKAVRLLNDFEAVAYSIPSLKAEDCVPLGLPEPCDLSCGDFTVGVVGPGTGLGAGGLCKRDGKLVPVVGEGGHVGFSPETRVQMDLLAALRERFDRVSDERLVSGQGLENIYWAVTRMHGEQRAALSAADISAQAADNSNARASEALQLFFEMLGQVAGNLALVLGASDGVFIAGGIARRYPDLLAHSRFRSGFEAKGRHRSLMEKVPTQLIMYSQPGLLGASHCAREMMRGRM